MTGARIKEGLKGVLLLTASAGILGFVLYGNSLNQARLALPEPTQKPVVLAEDVAGFPSLDVKGYCTQSADKYTSANGYALLEYTMRTPPPHSIGALDASRAYTQRRWT